MDLSNYEGALWYAGATLVAYYSADIGVCKGCISADGKVKKALHGLTALFFQRAVWAVVILAGRSIASLLSSQFLSLSFPSGSRFLLPDLLPSPSSSPTTSSSVGRLGPVLSSSLPSPLPLSLSAQAACFLGPVRGLATAGRKCPSVQRIPAFSAPNPSLFPPN